MKKILFILSLSMMLLITPSTMKAEMIVEEVYDGEDDVLFADSSMMEEEIGSWEKTDSRPNIDIVRVSYSRVEGSRLVTVSLEVNSRGFIEDTNTFGNATGFDENISGTMVTYMILLETSNNSYSVEYSNGTCYVNMEEVSADVSGNRLSVTFNLSDASETFVSISGYSYAFEIHSLMDMRMYMDIAPDSSMFIADAGGPYSGEVGEEIQFNGSYIDPLGFTKEPYTYEWDFDDGSKGSGENPTHVYKYPGNYTVTLTVKDSAGNTATATASVEITGAPSNGGETNGGTHNGGGSSNGGGNSGLLLFIAIVAIIIIIGIVALIVVIRR